MRSLTAFVLTLLVAAPAAAQGPSLERLLSRFAALPGLEAEFSEGLVTLAALVMADMPDPGPGGFGKLGMPLRIAVTAGRPAPELDLTLELVGREAGLRRIDAALARIADQAA